MSMLDALLGLKTLQNDGVSVPVRQELNFVGDGVLVADNPVTKKTDVTILSGALGVLCTSLDTLVGTVDRASLTCDGFSARNDGGGGQFIWKAGDTTPRNGGTIFGTAVSGRWFRVFSGPVSVQWFGASGTSPYVDNTAAIQSAINTGLNVDFPYGIYLAHGLTQSTATQQIRSSGGYALLAKNGNGTLLACTGNDVVLADIRFYGDGFAGHNVTMSGVHSQMLNCASDAAAGRAVLMTGEACAIVGCSGNYSTSDASATGWDIEFNGGTGQLLYGRIDGIRTSAGGSLGGVLMTACGAHVITDSQFGKLRSENGFGSGGTPRVHGCRITGNVDISQSNGTFSCNQFGTITITFAVGSGFNVLDGSNNVSAATIVDNGNNLIVSSPVSGSARKIRIGGSTSLGIIDIDPDGEMVLPGNTFVANSKAINLRNAGGTVGASLSVNASNNLFLTHGGAGFLQLQSNGTLQLAAGTNLPIALSSFLLRSNNLNVVAAPSSDQAGGIALLLTGDIIHVVTVAANNHSIALPPAPTAYGREVLVINRGASTLRIFPNAGDDVGAGANAAVTLVSGSQRRFFALNETTWLTV